MRHYENEEELWKRRERIRRKKRHLRQKRFRLFCLLGLAIFLTYQVIQMIPDRRKALPNTDAAATLETAAQTDDYSEMLLEALENNPELQEFVEGYADSDGTAHAELTEEEKLADYPLFLQWDTRWGYVPYGESLIGLAGCGPTCLSMVSYALMQDETMTPDKIAAYAEKNGFYVEGSGSAWSLMTDGASDLGLNGEELSLDENIMKRAIDAGKPIICAMRKGDFTQTGHFLVIYNYKEEGFCINDPNSRLKSEKIWSFEDLQYQIKNLWAYTAQ